MGGTYDPKTDNVSRTQPMNLQVMIQQGRIGIAESCSQAKAHETELRNLQPDGPPMDVSLECNSRFNR